MQKLIIKAIQSNKNCELCKCEKAEAKVIYKENLHKATILLCEKCLIKMLKDVIKKTEKEKKQKGE